MEFVSGLLESPTGLVVAGIAAFLIIAAGFLMRNPQWFNRSRPKATGSDPQVLARVGQIETRVTQIEKDLQHLPTKEDMHAFDKKLIRLEGNIHLIEATTTQTRNGVSQIQDYLLSISKKGAK